MDYMDDQQNNYQLIWMINKQIISLQLSDMESPLPHMSNTLTISESAIETKPNLKPQHVRNLSKQIKEPKTSITSKRKKRKSKSRHKKRRSLKKINSNINNNITYKMEHEYLQKENSELRHENESLRSIFKENINMENNYNNNSEIIVGLPSLVPIYSKDNGDEFDKDIKQNKKSNILNAIQLIDEHSQNIWNSEFNDKCTNINNCIAIQRIIRALKWYDKVNGDVDIIWQKIKNKKYDNYLVDDYHHIMYYHINKGDKITINNEINKFINKCEKKK
eukprot:351737_1